MRSARSLGTITFVSAIAISACVRDAHRAAPPARNPACTPSVWASPTRDTAHVASFAYTRCSDREHLLMSAGARDATADELLAFKQAHESEWFSRGGVVSAGLGGCCTSAKTPALCIRVDAPVCDSSVEEVAWVIADSLRRADPAHAIAMRFSVALVGMPGPRCDGGETCGPLGYSRRDEEPPMLDVARTVMPGYAGSGECAHDGECIAGGCGNSCVPWTQSHGIGTCELRGDLEDAHALCGCVEGACAWFTR